MCFSSYCKPAYTTTVLVKNKLKSPIFRAAFSAWTSLERIVNKSSGRPKAEMKQTIEKMQVQRKIDISLQIITCIDNDSEKARTRAKKTLSFYIAVGKIYREFLELNGYSDTVHKIYNEYNKTGLKKLDELVPDKILDDLCIAGTSEDGIKKLQSFREAGIELPIIQINPIGDTKESFELLTKTFSGELQ